MNQPQPQTPALLWVLIAMGVATAFLLGVLVVVIINDCIRNRDR